MMDGIRRDLIWGLAAAQRKNLTILAKNIGTTRATLSRFMNGKAPSFQTVRALQKELNIPPDMIAAIFFAERTQ